MKRRTKGVWALSAALLATLLLLLLTVPTDLMAQTTCPVLICYPAKYWCKAKCTTVPPCTPDRCRKDTCLDAVMGDPCTVLNARHKKGALS